MWRFFINGVALVLNHHPVAVYVHLQAVALFHLVEVVYVRLAEAVVYAHDLEEAVERPIPVVGNHGHNDDHNSHHHMVRMYMPLKQQPVQIILRLV